MVRDYYLGLASSGLRMPIGTDLVLHEHSDHAQIVLDGGLLGGVVEEAARRFKTPLAVPLMDLTLEKEAILSACAVPESERESYHFRAAPALRRAFQLTPRMRAVCAAIRHVATRTKLLPVGMSIGPFSLATKLISDPITPVFLAGAGEASSQESEVHLLEQLLTSATDAVLQYLQAQVDAGAKAILICEPAANIVYFSPNQLSRSYEGFDRLVMAPQAKVKTLLNRHDVDLFLHDCGELSREMVERFASLDPAILSLGSSRRLWEDAALVPKSTVLYGNLPTKKFYSDALISLDEVRRLALELTQRMREAQHPFVLGSECDVLSVPGAERTIMEKVEAFLTCA